MRSRPSPALALVFLVCLFGLVPGIASRAHAAEPLDLEPIQGVMAMQRIDGWLLTDDRGQNPIALEIVGPERLPTRRWFYLVPSRGEPVALVHRVDRLAFVRVPGRKIEYAGWRELEAGLKEILAGRRRVALEYSPMGQLPLVSRVDAGTVERIRAHRVEVVSSAELVQAAKSRWGTAGRASHYVAVHHLVALKDDALAFIAAETRAGRTVTEYDVQKRLLRGYETRGLESDAPPIVAAGANSANPHYVPTAAESKPIRVGDLVLLELWARIRGRPGAIYANITWMAYVGEEVPRRYADVFDVVVRARDATLKMIDERVKARRPVRGWEADQVARGVIARAGHGDRFPHRTGHSLDTRPQGDGANLDDFETRDTRSLLLGAGFTVEPGIYVPGDFGVRTEVNCYVGPEGLEVTTPVQKEITPLWAPGAAPRGSAPGDRER